MLQNLMVAWGGIEPPTQGFSNYGSENIEFEFICILAINYRKATIIDSQQYEKIKNWWSI